MKRSVWSLVLAAATIAAIPGIAAVRAQPQTRAAVEVRRVDIHERVEGAGQLARAGQEWVAAAGGVVEAVYVRAGDAVAAGQPLFALSNPQLQMQLELAYAECGRLRAQLRQAEAVSAATAELLRPGLLAAERAAELLARQVAALTVRAPRDARVLEADLSPGQAAATGAGVWIGEDAWRVSAVIDDRDAMRVAPGQPAIVWIGDAAIGAVVLDAAQVASAQSGTRAGVRVEIGIEDARGYPAGTRVDVEIRTRSRAGVAGIPLEAVGAGMMEGAGTMGAETEMEAGGAGDGDGAAGKDGAVGAMDGDGALDALDALDADEGFGVVHVWSRDLGRFVERRVKLGLRDALYVEAVSGVEVGDLLAVE